MKTNLVIAVFALLIIACNDKYEYWDISKFNLQENALKNREEVKILYTSRAPDNNKDLKYFIQLVAVSQETGDTVNILTTTNNGIGKSDEQTVFNFLNADDLGTKILQTDVDDIENLDIKKLSKAKTKQIKKVVRDPEFDFLADNNYPTVIGSIGHHYPAETSKVQVPIKSENEKKYHLSPFDLSNWEETPHVSGRVGTKEDMTEGRAVFAINGKGHEHVVLDIQIPALAYFINDESKTKELVVVIQAERAGAEEVIGIKYMNGKPAACTLAELEFIENPSELKKTPYNTSHEK